MSATPAFKAETGFAEPSPAPASPPRESPWASSDVAAPPQPSPARALQHELARRLQEGEAPHWSPRRTLLFILVTCGCFWIAAAAVVARFLH